MKKQSTHTFFNTVTLGAAAALLLACSTSFAADAPAMTEEQKTLYAVGISVSRSLAAFDLTPAELDYVKQGLNDAQTGKKLEVDLTMYNGKIQELAKARRKAQGKKQAGAGKEFIENAAKEKGAVKTQSGIVYIPTVEGKGTSPTATDIVRVNYRGTLVDGKEFDSSFKRGNPLEFKLDNVIKCWTEALQLMKPGGKAKLVCPPFMAYGDTGAGDLILPGATLAFEVDLLEVNPTTTPKPLSFTPAATEAAQPAAEHKEPENGKDAPHKH